MTSTKPFTKSSMTTGGMMFLVILSLLPSVYMGVFHYGLHAALIIVLSTSTAVVCELLFEVIFRRTITINDYSAAVSGLILGMILPPNVPLYFPVVGSAVGILAFKMAFGGIGKNILNPAMTGKLLLVVAFRSKMNDYSCDSFGKQTPLTDMVNGNDVNLVDLLTGNTAACIGTGCAVAILAGAVILLLVGIIDLSIPIGAFISFTILMILFGKNGWNPVFLAVQYIGGSFLFTVFFMAEDYSTRPLTKKGRFIFGLIFGCFIAVFRLMGYVEDAVVFALILCDLTVVIIDRKLLPVPFGLIQTGRSARKIREARRRRERLERERAEEKDSDDMVWENELDTDVLESDSRTPEDRG